jgi:hypothetical protein
MNIRNEEQLLELITDIEREIVEIIHPQTKIKGESPYHIQSNNTYESQKYE